MPRKPSQKNVDNPLRVLRVLCSEHGETAPLTQVRMAQITGIAPDYIRSLENSRRPINPSQLDKIRYSIGAVWDRKRKMWMVNALPNEPFTYEWFLRYRTLWFVDQFQADVETHMLCRRLQALLLGVEPSDYNLVFDRIFHALEDIRTELKVGAAKSVFEKTAFEIEYHRIPIPDETGTLRRTGGIGSIQRRFKFADKEICRDDIQSGIPGGFLNLTPYSFSITHPYKAQVTFDAASNAIRIDVPSDFDEWAKKRRAKKGDA
jgi:hypothetical protein